MSCTITIGLGRHLNTTRYPYNNHEISLDYFDSGEVMQYSIDDQIFLPSSGATIDLAKQEAQRIVDAQNRS